MAINNFQFPGVELHQEFVDTPVTGVSALGVAVIGQKYDVADSHSENPVIDLTVSGATVYNTGTAKTIPTASLPVDLANSLKNATLDSDFGQYIVIEDGDIYRDSADISGVTGTTTESTTKDFVFTTALTDAQAQVGDAIYVKVGTGTTYTRGIVTGINDTHVYAQFETAVGGNTSYKARFAATTGGVSAKATNYITSGASPSVVIPATLNATITGASTATVVAQIRKFSVWYRAIPAVTKNELGVISSFSDIVDQLGTPSVNNPLALACWFALSNSNGNVVYYVAVTTTGTSGSRYTSAMDFLARNPEVYSIVPLLDATDADQLAELQNCIAMATTDSEDKESKIRRTVWYGVAAPTSYSSRADLVAQIRANKKGIASYRAQAVFADGAKYGGDTIPNYIVAAAPAGMRAGQAVHRPISNLGYSVFSVEDTNGLTRSELQQIGADGIWIIAQNFYGNPINMRQVTTADSQNLNLIEESMVANVDNIALTLCHLGEDMVGCSNISPALITALTDGITTVMSGKAKNNTGSDLIGPQLLSWSLDSIYQDEVLRDHVYATMTCEPPRPFNRFVMTLRVV